VYNHTTDGYTYASLYTKNSGIKNRLCSAYIGAYKCSLTFGSLRMAQNEPNIRFKCSMFRALITRTHFFKRKTKRTWGH